MTAQGEPRRGTVLLVVVIIVSMLGLGVHGSRYAVLAAGRLHRVPASSGSSDAYGASGSLRIAQSCLRWDNPPTSARIPVDDPFSRDLSTYGDGAELQRLYAVKGRQLVPLDGAGPVRDCDAQLWGIVSRTTPDRVIAVVSEFMVFDADFAATTSGAVTGEVEPRLGHDSGSWRLAIAPNGASDIALALAVAHEVAHLSSLDDSQIRVADACATEETDLGCFADDAFLPRFTASTWTATERKEWGVAVNRSDAHKVHAALKAFAAAHRADFVTAYAATSTREDFAETFAYWCVFGLHNPLMGDFVAADATNGAAKLAWMDDRTNVIAGEHIRGCERLRELTR